MKSTMAAIAAVVAIAPLAVAQAQAPGVEQVGRKHLYVSAGAFAPDGNSQLRNQSGQYGLSLGFGSRFAPNWSWEIDFLMAEQRLDTPAAFRSPVFLTTTSGRSTISSFGLGGGVKYSLPLGRFEPYLGGGIGFYRTTLKVPRQQLLFISNDVKRNDSGIGFQFLAGADVHFGARSALGLQYRKLDLKAQFGTEVPGEVRVGGDFLFLQYRHAF